MKHILVVDDNKYLLDGLTLHLRMKLGQCSYLTAMNGGSALEILDATAVDFLLTDLQMPEMDGYELLERTKKRFPHLPVYVMTGESSPAIEQRVEAAGARRCIAKPINITRLVKLISSELNVEMDNRTIGCSIA